MPTRRWFLVSASTLAVWPACTVRGSLRSAGDQRVATSVSANDPTAPPDPAEPDPREPTEPGAEPDGPWVPAGQVDPALFGWGVQSGDATADGVMVGVRTGAPAVRMVLARGHASGWEEVLELGELPVDDAVVQVEIVDLLPDTTYGVVFYADDTRRSRVARFRTALAAGATRSIRFGATSCLGGHEPWPTLTHAAGERLDFFVLLGDTIYADDNGWGDLDHEASWEEALAVQGLVDVTGSTSVVAIWDDHEVDNGWSWDDPGMPETALDAAAAFRRAIPQRIGTGGSGFWRQLRWGDALELFVLDCRGERGDGLYISTEQMDWIKAALSASTAVFKIVVNSVPITDMRDVYFDIADDDRWDGFPEQQAELMDHIVDEAVPGVLFLGGDFHWGALAHISRPGGPWYDQWEVFCGPGGSSINPVAFLVQPNDHYEIVVARWNYVRFEADPASGRIRVSFVGDSGDVIGERVLDLGTP